MKLTNPRLGVLKISNAFVSEIGADALAHEKRAFNGQEYVNYYGVDEDFKIQGTVASTDDYRKLIKYGGDRVSVSESAVNRKEASGDYVIKKVKVKDFSLENGWYHVEFVLKKYFKTL